MYNAPPQPGNITMGRPSAGPLSATRRRTPVVSETNRCVMSRLPAGKTSSGESGLAIQRLTISPFHRSAVPACSHHFDRASREASDEAEPERDVGPAFVARLMILERIH